MIRIAQQKDIPVLSEIWSQAFADSKSYIDFFMKKRFSSCVSLVNETQERISSALYLLPGELMIEGNAHKAVYLYAAATIPEDRGKGYMSALLKQAEQTAAERGAEFIALVPGDEKLFDFYSKRGYSTAFSVREITINKEKINSAENVGYRFSYGILPDFGALYSLRSKVLGDTVYFSWSEDALKYAYSEAQKSAENCILAFRGSNLCAAALYSINDDEVEISDICAKSEVFPYLFFEIFSKTGAKRIKAYAPVEQNFLLAESKVKINGMLLETSAAPKGLYERIISEKDAYMSLSME